MYSAHEHVGPMDYFYGVHLEVPDFSSMSQEWQHHHREGVALHGQGEVDQIGLGVDNEEPKAQHSKCVCEMFQ